MTEQQTKELFNIHIATNDARNVLVRRFRSIAMNVWKDNQATNEALQPYMDLQLVQIMTAHGSAQGQAGYVATLSDYRTATTAMVEDAIGMLQRTASAEYKEIIREFHEMYLSWLVNANRLSESTTLARYF